MAKKSKVKDSLTLRMSVGSFWGSPNANKTNDFEFYKSYLANKHGQKDWLAMKLAKEDKAWILQFFNNKGGKKPSFAPPLARLAKTPRPRPKAPKRKLERIVINEVREEEDIQDVGGKVTIFVDAGTKNNGRTNQETRIVGVNGLGELVFDEIIGNCTNNQGEIRAILAVLKVAEGNAWSLNIYSDSKIAIGWAMRGLTRNSVENDSFAQKARELLKKTDSFISWVPRNINLAGIYIEENYDL